MTKILFYLLFLFPVVSDYGSKHPFYLSVTDLVYNSQSKTIAVTVKMFANDFERSLRNTSKQNLDLYHPKDSSLLEKQIKQYITSCLTIFVNGKPLKLQYLGHEVESESCFAYFESEALSWPKKLIIDNKLLYDVFREQNNIVQVEGPIGHKSARVSFPDSQLEFDFDIGNQ